MNRSKIGILRFVLFLASLGAAWSAQSVPSSDLPNDYKTRVRIYVKRESKMRVPDELIHLDSPEPVRLRRPALGLNAGDTVIIVRVQYTPKSGTGAVSLAVVEDIVAFKGGLILGSLRAEDVVVDRAP